MRGMATATHLLADVQLGDAGPLSAFVAVRRNNGRSWRRIAANLHEQTGIDVTSETLRSWFPEAA